MAELRNMHIVYQYREELSYEVFQFFSSRYSARLHRVDEKIEEEHTDLLVFQDGIGYSQSFLRFRRFPLLFVSTRREVEGYVAPVPNLFGAVNLSGVNLTLTGIPEEMQLHLQRPVEQTGDFYFYEQQPEVCRIAYCPTGNNLSENDFKLMAFVGRTNAELTIVSDRYGALQQALPPFVKVVPEKSKLPVFKKAHLVVASGLDVLRALALCKPCVVLGDYGLGGFVTPENFEQLRSVSFAGRKGAAWGEFVPGDLLETEIRKVFFTDYREQVRALQQQVKELYSKKQFADRLTAEVERIVSLSALLKDRKRRLELKPFRSSLFEIKEVEGKRYLMRGWQCFGEVEEEMAQLLMQCDGTRSVQELVARNGYDREEASVLWANLQALWNEKLILFAL